MKSVPFLCCLSLFCLIAGTNQSSIASDAETAAGKVDLTPKNTSIEFVGVHADPDKPDPRHGRFQKFSGTATVDQTLKSVQVEIETASLTTKINKLTNHLKSPDFFDVRRHPKARFKSTKIVDKKDGTVEITGNLTLLDETNSLTFPATLSAEGDLKLEAKFKIDRTKWGMDYGTENVKKMVELTIKIGKK